MSLASATPSRPAARAAQASNWLATWGASPQVATPGSLAATGFDNQTVRNVVFTSAAGSIVRVRFTNTFGTQPLLIGDAAIALASPGAAAGTSAATVAGTNTRLTFAGKRSILIAPGAEALSDPVAMTVPALADLAVSVYLPQSTGPATNHSDAQQDNWVAAGDHALGTSGTAFTTDTQSWYFIDGIDVVAASQDIGTVVAFGDSITDGYHSDVDANGRWPNDLARRLDALTGDTLSVADEGISGNRVLNDSLCCGVNAQARFERDVVERAGAKDVILLEGINDIGFSQLASSPLTNPNTNVSAAQIIAGYEQLIADAHAGGLKIFGATLTPFRGASYWSAQGELKREAVNKWILTSGAFDGVIDFAKAVAEPGDPQVMNPAFDSGDHLHPNDAGYQAMANAIDLSMLTGS
ncbi:MAG: SGNH/GDSL hydrolase family protein [Solirubrobacteraceae bacterium]